jgi:hypothetical protein
MLRRPVGPPRKFVNPVSDPKGAFGYSEWGFTKATELFAGRIAMLVRAMMMHGRMRFDRQRLHGEEVTLGLCRIVQTAPGAAHWLRRMAASHCGHSA